MGAALSKGRPPHAGARLSFPSTVTTSVPNADVSRSFQLLVVMAPSVLFPPEGGRSFCAKGPDGPLETRAGTATDMVRVRPSGPLSSRLCFASAKALFAQVSAKASTAVATEAVEAGAQYLLLEPKWLRIKERVQGCVAPLLPSPLPLLMIPTDSILVCGPTGGVRNLTPRAR